MTYLANASSSPLVPGTSMGNMQGFTSGAGTSLIRMPDGSVRRVGVNDIPEGATQLSVDGQKTNNSEKPELVEQGGVMVAKDRATGLARPFASSVDWLTGNWTDFDRMGDGTGVAHPHTGAGEVAPNFEKDAKGDITKKTPEDPRSDWEKGTGMKFDEYLKKMEEVQKRAGERKFKQEQLARLPDLAFNAAGGAYATALQPGIQAVADIGSSIRHHQMQPIQLPKLQDFASLLG